jgi:hypothetical protein
VNPYDHIRECENDQLPEWEWKGIEEKISLIPVEALVDVLKKDKDRLQRSRPKKWFLADAKIDNLIAAIKKNDENGTIVLPDSVIARSISVMNQKYCVIPPGKESPDETPVITMLFKMNRIVLLDIDDTISITDATLIRKILLTNYIKTLSSWVFERVQVVKLFSEPAPSPLPQWEDLVQPEPTARAANVEKAREKLKEKQMKQWQEKTLPDMLKVAMLCERDGAKARTRGELHSLCERAGVEFNNADFELLRNSLPETHVQHTPGRKAKG